MAAQSSPDSRADTRLYLVVHNAFRLATIRFVNAAEKLEPSALQQTIGSLWGFYAAVLHHHHHSEDNSIFPALVAARPDLDALMRRLENEHQHLIVAMDAVVAVRDLFFPHLDTEDAEILPAIAESLRADEWERIDQATFKSLPRQYLSKVVGSMDEIIQGLPKEERPPPPPLPIQLMLALSWRKKWSTWMKPLLV